MGRIQTARKEKRGTLVEFQPHAQGGHHVSILILSKLKPRKFPQKYLQFFRPHECKFKLEEEKW